MSRSRFGGLALLAAFGAFCFAIFAFLLSASGRDLVPKDRYEVLAAVPSALALAPAAEVRMAGVRVGKVKRIAARDGDTVLLLQIDDDDAPVHRDARVQVRLKSLVGENYVDVDPGHPSAGDVPDGATLPLSNSEDSPQLDEILSTLDAPTRRNLRRLAAGIGGGLRDRGADLNRLLGGVSYLVDESRPLLADLRAQRRDVTALVDHLGSVMRAVGDRGTAIEVFAHRARRVAEVLGARDDAVRDTLAELPSMLAAARSATGRLAAFAPRATPVVRDLRVALNAARPLIRELRPAAASTRAAVHALERFIPPGLRLLPSLRLLASATTSAVPEIDETLRQANPLLRYLKPYSAELGAFFANARSATSSHDATGHIARIQGVVGDASLAWTTPLEKQALDALFASGALAPIRKQEYNPYPAPGTIGRPSQHDGRYPRLQADPRRRP